MAAKREFLEQQIATNTREGIEYICITDIARYKNSGHTDDLIRHRLRNRNTIELLSIWEQLNSSNCKPVELGGFKKQVGLNSFTLTPKQWIEQTGAIGLISKAGRYGGTYAQKTLSLNLPVGSRLSLSWPFRK